MSYMGRDLDPGTWGESILRALNFQHVVPLGEMIASVEPWTCRVASDSTDPDASASDRVDGVAAIDGTRSEQRLTFPSGTTRVKYILEGEITTNRGNVIKRYTHMWILPYRMAPDFTGGEASEDVNHTFDFDKDLSEGEFIVSSDQWSIAVAPDSPNADPDAASRVTGISTHGKTESYQRITLPDDLTVPVKYLLGATVTTSLGNVIKLYAYKTVRAPS